MRKEAGDVFPHCKGGAQSEVVWFYVQTFTFVSSHLTFYQPLLGLGYSLGVEVILDRKNSSAIRMFAQDFLVLYVKDAGISHDIENL